MAAVSDAHAALQFGTAYLSRDVIPSCISLRDCRFCALENCCLLPSEIQLVTHSHI